MDNFNLKKYLAEGKILKENQEQSTVYVAIPFYSGGGINENDVMVFQNYEDASSYVNGLEGSPMIVETELK